MAETTRRYERSYGTAVPAGENAKTQVMHAGVPSDAFGTDPTRTLGHAPLEAPLDAALSTPSDEEQQAAEQLPAGTRVGRYLVLAHIGAGGLGDVYAAFDSELDRKVAIKILRPSARDKSLGDPTQRLLREAQALAKLRHPNVVTVFDVGTFRDEVFVAMEFVAGRTLTRWLRELDPDWRRVRDTYVLAGRGLAAAHAASLVHRDFKLDNVLVGDDGHVTVLDFGLARAIGRIAGDIGTLPIPLGSAEAMHAPMASLLDRDVTRASLVLGTPPYMAPELLTGESATAHTDQFAFGVALFKGLHRRLPFVATTLAEHYEATRQGKIVHRPEDSSVPGWLRKAVERALEPDPRRRFASMEALLHALVADRTRRRRGLLSIAFAVPLLSVAVATVAVATRPEPTQTERALTLQLAEEARAAAANGYYVFPPSDAPQTPTALSKVVELEGLDGTIAAEGTRLGGELRNELSDALVRLGDRYYDRPGGPPFAADFYAAALVFNPEHERARDRVTWTAGQLAELTRRAQAGDFTSGELAAAEALAVLAVEDATTRAERVREYFGDREAASATTPTMLEAVLSEDERVVAEQALRTRTKKPRAAVSSPDEALRDPEPSLEAPPTVPAEALELVDPFDAAEVDAAPTEPVPLEASATPRPAAAASPTPASVPEEEDTPARRAQATADAKAGLAALRSGQLDRAEELFHRALRANRRNVTALSGLGKLYFERGEYEKAVTYGKRAVSAAPKSRAAYVDLGDAYVKEVRYDDARAAYERAIKLGSSDAKERLGRLDKQVGK